MQIDQENEALEESSQPQLKNRIGRDSIVQLPNNHIPKGLVPFEKLFERNDVPYKVAQKKDQFAVHKHNIGSPEHPMYINLSTHLSTAQSLEYCTLMKQFVDVFAWDTVTLKRMIKRSSSIRSPWRKTPSLSSRS